MMLDLIIQLIPALAIFIAIIAFWLSYRNFRKFGSVLGVSYDLIILMMAVATAGFILHAFVSNHILPDDIVTKILSEGMFLFEAILIVAASVVAKRHFDDLFKDKDEKDDLKRREQRLRELEEEEGKSLEKEE